VLVAAGVLLLAATLAPAAPSRVLVVTYSAGYQHDVVRRPAPAEPSTVERVLADLGRRSGSFDVTLVAARDELDRLTPTSVRAHRAIVFFTTGELPIAAAVRQAMFQSIRDGGGFVGVHSATDTWYTIPEYRELLGAAFDGHPWHQRVRLVVEDRTHPASRQLGDTFEISDEIYQFRDWSRSQVHVLLRLDQNSVDARRGKRADGDYVLGWTKTYGRGRVIYTALGHEPAVWADGRFQAHLLGAIQWALGGA
jgi:type 1 glutamine amidotransferase